MGDMLFSILGTVCEPPKGKSWGGKPPVRYKRWFLRWFSDDSEEFRSGETRPYMNEVAALRAKDDFDGICVLYEGTYISSGSAGGLVKLSETRVRRVQ